MVNITVCIGSSCHIKGSRQIVEQLQYLIAKHNVGDRITLSGTFCMGKCQSGVCVKVNDELFSLSPEQVQGFFDKEVLGRL